MKQMSGWIGVGIIFLVALMALAINFNSGATLPEHSANHEAGAADAFTTVVYGDAVAATVTAGQTSAAVTHAVGTTPAQVACTPNMDPGTHTWWISAKAATTFTLTIDSTDLADLTFDCVAVR